MILRHNLFGFESVAPSLGALGLLCALLLACGGDPSAAPNGAETPDAAASDAAASDAGASDPELADESSADSNSPETDNWDRSPALGGHFIEVTEAYGLAAVTGFAASSMPGGVALVDLDGDGWLDLVIAQDDGPLQTFYNRTNDSQTNDDQTNDNQTSDGGRRFLPAESESGLASSDSIVVGGTSLAPADWDNDGDVDLYVGTVTGGRLLENDGGHFTDATAELGLTSTFVMGGATFGDFDGDGLLDLYETTYAITANPGLPAGQANILYRNTGDGFDPIEGSPGSREGELGITVAAAFSDADGDGDLDLFVVNDFGHIVTGNQLYRNDGPLGPPSDVGSSGWRWEPVGNALGFDHALFGMGLGIGDIDNDGDLDVYVPNAGDNLLLIRSELGFVDEAAARHVSAGHYLDPLASVGETPSWNTFDPQAESPIEQAMYSFCEAYCDPDRNEWVLTSWNGLIFDADQDGWQDLFVSHGSAGLGRGVLPEGSDQPNYLYLNSGDGTFERAPVAVFPELFGGSRGAAVGDVDHDGDLDLVWLDTGFQGAAGIHLMENRMADGNWLRLRLAGTTSALDSVGARVTLHTEGAQQTRELRLNAGYLSASEPVLHFGLGERETVQSLEIRWPSGTVQTVTAPSLNQTLELTEP